jgi:hypothetical protein
MAIKLNDIRAPDIHINADIACSGFQEKVFIVCAGREASFARRLGRSISTS